MPATIKALKEQIDEQHARIDAILAIAQEDNDRSLTDVEQKEIDEIQGIGEDGGRIGKMKAELDRLQKIEDRQKSIIAQNANQRHPLVHTQADVAPFKVPRAAMRYGKPKAFPTIEDAYVAGQFLMATVYGNERSGHWLEDQGYAIQNTLRTDNNELGGYLVPEPLEAALIVLQEQFGVFRRNVGMQKPMTGGAWNGPRMISSLTVYHPGEGNAPTASDVNLGQVSLKAKDAVALTSYTRNVEADAVIAVADMITRQLAYAHAQQEDQNGFNGDGTSTYNSIVGLKNAIAAGSTVTAAAGDDTFAELEAAFFESAAGALPDYAGAQAAWFVSKPMYFASMARLQLAGGGNTVMDLGNGPVFQHLGYPVVFTQVLPKALTTLAETIVGFLGDLSYTAAMGTARGMAIESDPSVYFTQRQIAVMGWQRYDINVYERGTASVAGPMIALKMGTA